VVDIVSTDVYVTKVMHGLKLKRRKSRTAFTNQQIFELERRFVRQKYISPADRDHIATTVGITAAQVLRVFLQFFTRANV